MILNTDFGMNDIRISTDLLPKSIITPVAFIAENHPGLHNYGVDTGDLVIVDSGVKFVNGALSAFKSKKDFGYRLSKEKLRGYTHFGKVVIAMKYYGVNPSFNYE